MKFVFIFSFISFFISCRLTHDYSRMKYNWSTSHIQKGLIISKDSTKNGVVFIWRDNKIFVSNLQNDKTTRIKQFFFKKTLNLNSSIKYMDFSSLTGEKEKLDSIQFMVSSDYNNQPKLFVFVINNGEVKFLFDSFKVKLSTDEEIFFNFSNQLLNHK